MKDQVASSMITSEADGSSVRAEFLFSPQLPVFAGHFPGRPLVPGVFLIESVRLACERALDHGLLITEILQAKFSAEAPPGEPIALALRLDENPESIRCDGILSHHEKTVASIQLRLAIQREE